MGNCKHEFRFYSHTATCIKCKCTVMQAYGELEKQLEKYKAAIGYFQREGTQVEKDIVKNLLSY